MYDSFLDKGLAFTISSPEIDNGMSGFESRLIELFVTDSVVGTDEKTE